MLGHSPYKLESAPRISAHTEAQPLVLVSGELVGEDAHSVLEALNSGATVTDDGHNPARWVQISNLVLPMETVARATPPKPAVSSIAALRPSPAAFRRDTSEISIEKRSWLAWTIGFALLVTIAAITFWLWPESHETPARQGLAAATPASKTITATPPTKPTSKATPAATPSVAAAPVIAANVTDARKPSVTTERAAAIDHGSCSIHVDADVPDSVVIVDGHVVGSAPADAAGIYCGHRTLVTVANTRFAPWQRWIVPEEGKPSQVRASLSHLTTAMAVTSTPSGATVRVNGKQVAVTPAAIPVVADASTTIELSLAGYATFTKQLVPRAGATVTIDTTLVPEPVPQQGR